MTAGMVVALGSSAAAVGTDLARRRIPNRLTLLAAIGGIFTHGVLAGQFADSALGGLVGLAILLIPFLFGGMGGGDVKLLGALGTALGVRGILDAGLVMALAGGVIAAAVQWNVLGMRKVLGRPWIPKGEPNAQAGQAKLGGTDVSIPYGAAIFFGVLAAVLSGMAGGT